MELTAALRFTGAHFKPMVGVKPLSLEKEDGEVRKAFAAWLCTGKVLEAGLDGHRKGTVKGFDGGGLGGMIRSLWTGERNEAQITAGAIRTDSKSPGDRS